MGCWWLLNKTKWGTLLKAVIYDREMGISMGINVPLVYTMTFIGGAILGGLGGAYIAPTISVAPGLGTEVIVLSFAVVVVGGMGSIAGAAIGSLIIGILRALAVHELPQVELFVVFAVMAIVLVFRPEGLFAPAKPRKDLNMFEDKTSKFVLFGGLLIILVGAFAPNWIVNQFMFGFSRALAIVA